MFVLEECYHFDRGDSSWGSHLSGEALEELSDWMIAEINRLDEVNEQLGQDLAEDCRRFWQEHPDAFNALFDHLSECKHTNLTHTA